jgi:Putative auto-transporter adhesin, head GIN domain
MNEAERVSQKAPSANLGIGREGLDPSAHRVRREGQVTVAPTSVHPRREHHRSRWILAAILAFLLGGLGVALLYESNVFGGSSSSSSSVEGSGVAASETRDVNPFGSVELAGSNNVVIHAGEQQSVIVSADDNLLDRVTTEVQSGKLVIGNTTGSFSTNSPMSVEVSVPTLSALTLSGSGNIVVGGIKADSLTVSLPGSGTLTASGTTTRLGVTVSGSGMVQFNRLVASDVQAVVSGSGTVFVIATKSLDASVPGDGTIIYAGNPPDITRSITGTGAITTTS